MNNKVLSINKGIELADASTQKEAVANDTIDIVNNKNTQNALLKETEQKELTAKIASETEKRKQSKNEKKADKEKQKKAKALSMKETIIEKAKNRENRLLYKEGSFALDNAALIYPASRTGDWNAAYRVSAILKEDIIAENLQKALDLTMDRFPYYNVALKRGVFWHYFQVLSHKPKIELENNYPCSVFDFRGDKPIFRILYLKNKASIESFHSIGDGYGAILLLNAILMNYFDICGKKIDFKNYFVNPRDIYDIEETEDAFLKYADLKEHSSRKENKAWQVKGTPLEYGQTRIINGIVETTKLKEKAKEFNASINDFLLASLIFSLLETKKQSKNKKNYVKVSLPIDCRRFFTTKTMRNFSSYKNFELKDETLDFQGIINFVADEMKEITKDYLLKNINANVLPQKNFFVRVMPLSIKDIVLKMCFNAFGEKLFTTAFSNIGLIKAPTEFAELIERYDVMIGGGKLNGINVATCSYNNQTVITFSRKIRETLAEKNFFRHLSSLGLEVLIETN